MSAPGYRRLRPARPAPNGAPVLSGTRALRKPATPKTTCFSRERAGSSAKQECRARPTFGAPLGEIAGSPTEVPVWVAAIAPRAYCKWCAMMIRSRSSSAMARSLSVIRASLPDAAAS